MRQPSHHSTERGTVTDVGLDYYMYRQYMLLLEGASRTAISRIPTLPVGNLAELTALLCASNYVSEE